MSELAHDRGELLARQRDHRRPQTPAAPRPAAPVRSRIIWLDAPVMMPNTHLRVYGYGSEIDPPDWLVGER